MEYNYKVYAHINKTNGKIYVGITCKSLKQRWGNGKGYNGHFGRAINKYGWDGFEHELIASGLTEKEAKCFEILLIDKLKTQDEEYGYNLTKGGDGTCGYRHSEESKNKMSDRGKGKKIPEHVKILISERFKGIAFTEEHKLKISIALRGKPKSEKTKFKMKLNHNYHLTIAL